MSRLPIYVTVEANEPFKLEQELQQRAIEGYRALFPVEFNNGKTVIVMQREPQPGDEPSVYETRGIRTL